MEQKMLIKGSKSHQQGVFCVSQWDPRGAQVQQH